MDQELVSYLEKRFGELEERLNRQVEDRVEGLHVRAIALAVLALDERCKTLEAFQEEFIGEISDTRFLQRRVGALERWREAEERAAIESVRDSFKRREQL